MRKKAKNIGSYAAKTHLSELLDRVEKGDEIVITRHGVPVAKLSPPVPGALRADPRVVIARLLEFRRRHSLGGLSVRELIEEGRRF